MATSAASGELGVYFLLPTETKPTSLTAMMALTFKNVPFLSDLPNLMPTATQVTRNTVNNGQVTFPGTQTKANGTITGVDDTNNVGQEILNKTAHEEHPDFVKNATAVVCERFPNGRVVYAECSVLSSNFALATENPVEVTYGFIVKGKTFVTIDTGTIAADTTGDLT